LVCFDGFRWFWDLTSDFAGENEEKNAKAIDQSFRPLGYTPAFGRAEALTARFFATRLNAYPGARDAEVAGEVIPASTIGPLFASSIKDV
jgi:hypothetical protein